jgi:hypothetical protein
MSEAILRGATMPDGHSYEEWRKDKEAAQGGLGRTAALRKTC